MKIYSKTNSSHGYFHGNIFFSLSFARGRPNSVYWYDCHDFVVRGLHIKDCLDEQHWQHLRTDDTAKFLIFHPDEFFNYFDIENWLPVLKEKGIPPDRVYIVVSDENWVEWFKRIAKDHFDYTGFHIDYLPLLMGLCNPKEKKPIERRFSLLSRNYQRWRLNFFLRLLDKDLLHHINYTFNNVDPYGTIKVFPHSQLIEDAKGMGFQMYKETLEWINNVPYTFSEVDIQKKFNDVIYNVIQTAGINITIESQCDPHYFFPHYKHIPPKDFSVAFPTEKTFKAISCARPFISVSSPLFLQQLRNLGFKTFHEFIDESYDEIFDLNERFAAIVNEIERLSNLPDTEFNELLANLQPIADHNLEVLKERTRSLELSSEFDFLRPFVRSEFLSQSVLPENKLC